MISESTSDVTVISPAGVLISQLVVMVSDVVVPGPISQIHSTSDINITDSTVTPILLRAGGLLAPTLKGGSTPRPGFLNSLLPHGHSVCHSHIPWKRSSVAPHPYVDLEEPATGPTVQS
jgi:hypothetical protein